MMAALPAILLGAGEPFSEFLAIVDSGSQIVVGYRVYQGLYGPAL